MFYITFYRKEEEKKIVLFNTERKIFDNSKLFDKKYF